MKKLLKTIPAIAIASIFSLNAYAHDTGRPDHDNKSGYRGYSEKIDKKHENRKLHHEKKKENFKHMTEAQKEKARKITERKKNMPPEQKEKFRKMRQKLKSMSKEERREFFKKMKDRKHKKGQHKGKAKGHSNE